MPPATPGGGGIKGKGESSGSGRTAAALFVFSPADCDARERNGTVRGTPGAMFRIFRHQKSCPCCSRKFRIYESPCTCPITQARTPPACAGEPTWRARPESHWARPRRTRINRPPSRTSWRGCATLSASAPRAGTSSSGWLESSAFRNGPRTARANVVGATMPLKGRGADGIGTTD